MKLKRKLSKEEHSKLPDPLKECYIAAGDSFLVDGIEPSEGWAYEDVAGLKNALAREKENAALAETLTKRLNGTPVDKLFEVYDRFKEMDKWTPSEKVQEQINARVQQIIEKHNNELKERDTNISALTSELHEGLVDAIIAKSCSKEGPTPGNAHALIPIVKQSGLIKVVRGQDGKSKAIVLQDDRKTPRITMKSGSTEEMGIEEYLTLLQSDSKYKGVFYGTTTTGSGGAGSSDKNSVAVGSEEFNKLSPEAKIALWRKTGQAS